MRRKKTERQIALGQCDDLWSELVKILAEHKCEVCGKTAYLNSHHFYSRANKSVRHDPKNGFCLCSGCHMMSSSFSAHLTPADFVDWARERRGEAWLKELRLRSQSCLSGMDYRLMAQWLKHEIHVASGGV